jgi:hypothetical protein
MQLRGAYLLGRKSNMPTRPVPAINRYEDDGFPVRRKRFSSKAPAHLMARAALPILAAGAAFTLHEVTVATLLFAVAGVPYAEQCRAW